MEDALIKFLFKSVILAALIVATMLVIGFASYVTSILLWSPPKDLKPHDAIVVLTGGAGRIETGFELLVDDRAPKMLISGVLEKISMNDIIENNTTNFTNGQKSKIDNHCCVELDYIADTTTTNAVETNQWVLQNDVQSIILVTSHSHMPRAYLNFAWILPEGVQITAYPYHAKTRLSLVVSQQFWQYALREYMKFGGTFIRLIQQH